MIEPINLLGKCSPLFGIAAQCGNEENARFIVTRNSVLPTEVVLEIVGDIL
jgi:hypothetical protein